MRFTDGLGAMEIRRKTMEETVAGLCRFFVTSL